MKPLIFLFCLSLILPGCKSNEPSHPIVGKWQWTESIGGFTGQMTVRPKPDERLIFQFTNNGTFSLSLNDTAGISGTYRLAAIRSIYKGADAPGIYLENVVYRKPYVFPGFQNQMVLMSLSRDKLELADNANDGYGCTLTRTN